MSVDFKFIGWNNEGTSDKFWGYFFHDSDANLDVYPRPCYVFWGRRGGALNFKKDYETGSLRDLVSKKKTKGYRWVDEKQLRTVWPNFEDQMEQRLCFCILANKIMGAN